MPTTKKTIAAPAKKVVKAPAPVRTAPVKTQPDENQSSRGTVFSRRWEGHSAPTIGPDHTLEITIQREPDRGAKADEAISFGLAVSLAMPGVVQVYNQARVRAGARAPCVTGAFASVQPVGCHPQSARRASHRHFEFTPTFDRRRLGRSTGECPFAWR